MDESFTIRSITCIKKINRVIFHFLLMLVLHCVSCATYIYTIHNKYFFACKISIL